MAEYDSKVMTGDKLKPILGNLEKMFGVRIGWGICSTPTDTDHDTTARTVNVGVVGNGIDTDGTFTLERGATFLVEFMYGFKAGDTLSVNGNTGTNVQMNNAALTEDIPAGTRLFLTYDSRYFQITSAGGRAVKVNGVEKIAATSTTPLDIVGENDTSVTWDSTNKKVKISTDISNKLGKDVTVYDSNGNVLADNVLATLAFLNSGNIDFFVYPGTGDPKIKAVSRYAQGYGTCSTAATTAAKTVSITDYTLVTGGVITVKFTYAVPANATLNVTSKGAKSIKFNGANIVAGIIGAGDTALLMYDGTAYDVIGLSSGTNKLGSGNASKVVVTDSNGKFAASSAVTDTELGYLNGVTSNVQNQINSKQDKIAIGGNEPGDTTILDAGHKIRLETDEDDPSLVRIVGIDNTPNELGIGYGTCDTATATAAKTTSIADYALVKDGIVAVYFAHAVNSGATLNVSSKGAKPIFFNGSALQTGVIGAGEIVLFMYDGTNYNIVGKTYNRATDSHPGVVTVDSTVSNADGLAPYAQGTSTNPIVVTYMGKLYIRLATSSIPGLMKLYGTVTQDNANAEDGSLTIKALETRYAFINGNSAKNFYATTAAKGTNSNQVATTEFVATAIGEAQTGAAMFQGTVGGANDTIKKDDDTTAGVTKFSTLTDYKKGWYWVVNANGTFVGQSCEKGDFIFCVNDKGAAYSADDFSVVQNNLDVITPDQVNTLWNDVFNPSSNS